MSRLVSWEQERAKHRPGKLKMTVLPSAATVELTCAVFMLPGSANMRVCWDLKQLYKVLRLTSFQGVVANWVAKGQGPWRKSFLDHLGGEHMCFSAAAPGGEHSAKHKLGFDRACLDNTSCSTLGVLWLLVRWGFHKVDRGGLSREIQRAAAAQLLCSVMFAGLLREDRFATIEAPSVSEIASIAGAVLRVRRSAGHSDMGFAQSVFLPSCRN